MFLIALCLALAGAVITFIFAVGSRRTIYSNKRETVIELAFKWIRLKIVKLAYLVR